MSLFEPAAAFVRGLTVASRTQDDIDRARASAKPGVVTRHLYLVGPAPNFLPFRLNVRSSETHGLQAEPTEHVLEDGRTVQDHVVTKPRRLSCEYEQTNAFDGKDAALEAWSALKDFWKRRSLLTALTEHEIYENMVVESVSAVHQAPMLDALRFSVSLRQINFAVLTYTAVPAETPKPEVAPTAGSSVNHGVQAPITVDDSDSSLGHLFRAWGFK